MTPESGISPEQSRVNRQIGLMIEELEKQNEQMRVSMYALGCSMLIGFGLLGIIVFTALLAQ